MKYLIKINKTMQPGTIGNYLNLVKQFNEFMFCDKPRDVCMGDCHLMMALYSNGLSLVESSNNSHNKSRGI